MRRKAVIIDKCFLQGSKKERIHALCKSHNVLVTNVLFYELVTSQAPEIAKCFAKFPDVENPVTLVQHAGALMHKEVLTLSPSGKPSHNPENIGLFRFNAALAGGQYSFPEDAKRTIEGVEVQTRDDVVSFLARVRLVPEIFPGLTATPGSKRLAAVDEAICAVVGDPSTVLGFYQLLEPPPGEVKLPPVGLVDPTWALFRWVQVQLLMSLDVFRRYGPNVPDISTMGRNGYVKIEHDLLDADYLILGLLEGSFATMEKKLKCYWFELLPNGDLIDD